MPSYVAERVVPRTFLLPALWSGRLLRGILPSHVVRVVQLRLKVTLWFGGKFIYKNPKSTLLCGGRLLIEATNTEPLIKVARWSQTLIEIHCERNPVSTAGANCVMLDSVSH